MARKKIVKDEDAETSFTQRVIMSMLVDLHCLAENIDRMNVQMFAIAKENGVPIPKWDE